MTTLSITKAKPAKGSGFTTEYRIDRNGQPFALLAKFNAEHGGNWYVGFATRHNDGGRFETYQDANEYIVRAAY